MPTASPRRSEDGFFDTHEGTPLFYRFWPAAAQKWDRAVVILHRGHEHSGRVQHIVDELGMPDAPMYAWDARGHGHSPGERGDSPDIGVSIKDVDDFVRHVSAVSEVPLENIIVVAQSVGAVLAAAWVHDYAPPIRGLVLASPAFKVKLYVPFARQALALRYALIGNFFVKSYVKARFLTHDPVRRESYDADPLIAKAISVRVLLGLYETGERLQADVSAITVPTQLFISGSDCVVYQKPQHRFFERLGSTIKEKHVLAGYYHDALGEKGRQAVFAQMRSFIDTLFTLPQKKLDTALVEQFSPSADAYRDLQSPLSSISPKGIFYRVYPWVLRLLGRFSKGVALGLETGFDSGSTLDYVYRNTPEGLGKFGRFADTQYLNSIGWRGIRIRKIHVEDLLRSAIARLTAAKTPVRILDIAAGHGRYVLDAVAGAEQVEHIHLRDFSPINVAAGTRSIEDRGLTEKAVFEQGDAFIRESLAKVEPKPTLAVVSGLYELFPENAPLRESLAGLADALPKGGYLVYTNQPWHPQHEMIARGLTSHRGGKPWVMRCRSQQEMDTLVQEAGFQKVDQLTDEWGIFTVSLAVRQ